MRALPILTVPEFEGGFCQPSLSCSTLLCCARFASMSVHHTCHTMNRPITKPAVMSSSPITPTTRDRTLGLLRACLALFLAADDRWAISPSQRPSGMSFWIVVDDACFVEPSPTASAMAEVAASESRRSHPGSQAVASPDSCVGSTGWDFCA